MPLLRSRLPETAEAGSFLPPADPSHALAHGTEEERRAVARDLAAAGAEAIPILAARLQTETAPCVRAAMLASLVHIGSVEAAAAVAPVLRSNEAAWRTAALDALQAMPGTAGEATCALLRDPDPDVRIMVNEVLRRCSDPRVPGWLAEVLGRDGSENVCAAALEVLTEIGTPAELDAVRALPGRFPANAFLRFAAALAVTRLQGG